MNNNRRFKLSEISDEQILELMDGVQSDEISEFSSDDSLNDPDFVDNDILSDDERYISSCIRNMNAAETSDFLVEAINFSINVSEIENSTITDAAPSTSAASRANISSSTVKTPKRMRSPLPSIEETGPVILPSSGGFTLSNLHDICKDSNEFSRMTWRKKSMCLHVNEVAFQGKSALPASITSLETPMQFFCYFFTKEIVTMITEETNRTAFSEDINTKFKTNVEEIYHYIGVLLFMSLYRFPNMDSYWGKNAFQPIQKTMPLKKFRAIKKYLRFQDESERIKKGNPGYDALFRIRKLAEELNKTFDSVPKTARLCVDEQMCATKIKHHLRQYLPNKPHKWGIKLFVLCDSFGYAYRFEIYNGAGDNIVLPGTPDLGSCANVVVRLSQTVPNFKNHIIFFDNFYTTLPLLVYLRARGIYSLGTVRANRIPNCKLPFDKDIKEKERGFSTEYMGRTCGIDITSVLWKDNRCVRLLSTYVGTKKFERSQTTGSTAKATRYDRKNKGFIDIDCPQIVREYNMHMGGVDLMDGLMGRYHIRAKTRNPITRIFYHLIDMAATNAYILYRRMEAEKKDTSAYNPEIKLLQLPNFREEIAAGLVSYNVKRLPGRSKSRSRTPQPASKIGQKSQHPVADVRFDGFKHFPKWLTKAEGKKKCKLCKTSQTQCICQKCNLHLCCSSAKNCFFEYHNPK